MTKTDMIKKIATNTIEVAEKGSYVEKKITKRQAEAIYNMMFGDDGIIVEGLMIDGEVLVQGFGKFIRVERGEYDIRNPRTGDIMTVEPKHSVRFRASESLKKIIK